MEFGVEKDGLLFALFQNDDLESVDETGCVSEYDDGVEVILFEVVAVVLVDNVNTGGIVFTGCNIA